MKIIKSVSHSKDQANNSSGAKFARQAFFPTRTSLYYFPRGIPQIFIAFICKVPLITATTRDAHFETTILTTDA